MVRFLCQFKKNLFKFCYLGGLHYVYFEYVNCARAIDCGLGVGGIVIVLVFPTGLRMDLWDRKEKLGYISFFVMGVCLLSSGIFMRFGFLNVDGCKFEYNTKYPAVKMGNMFLIKDGQRVCIHKNVDCTIKKVTDPDSANFLEVGCEFDKNNKPKKKFTFYNYESLAHKDVKNN